MPFGDSSEIVIRTGINLEETLTRLKAKLPPGMRIEYEKGGARPPGIAHLKYHGTWANLGSQGGVQIHYRSMEDLEDLLRILRANAVYLRKEGPWKVTKHRLGRSMLAELALDQAADLAATGQTKPSPILNELLDERRFGLMPEKVKDFLDRTSQKYIGPDWFRRLPSVDDHELFELLLRLRVNGSPLEKPC